MAEVFLARREGPSGFEKQLVVKRLLPHLSRKSRFTEMFLREARLSALIDHPNFVHVSAFGEEDGQYYLAMEYVDGTTIKQLLEHLGTFAPGVAARIAIDLLDALHAIHNATALDGRPLHLVHRDITPSNVMLTASGTVKLLDLGIAVSKDEGTPARAGTRKYMSPEQSRGDPVDARSDLYCVALLLALMISGRHPFDTQSVTIAYKRAPLPLQAIIRRLLEEDPEARPRSAREVQDQLEQFALGCGREGTRGALAKLASSAITSVPEASGGRGTASLEPSEALSSTPMGVRVELLESERPTLLHRSAELQALPRSRRAWLGVASLAALSVALGVAALAGRSEATPAVAAAPVRSAPPEAPPEPPAPVGSPRTPEEAPAIATVEKPVRQQRRASRRARTPKKKRPVGSSYLNIDARPWAIVFVDGRSLGQTPLARAEIPAGDHHVRLVNPDRGLEASYRIQSEPGKVVKIRGRFKGID